MRKKQVGALQGPRGTIADRVTWATTLGERRRGVLGRPPLGDDEALVLWPCRQVHTFGVPYALDAVFCDRRLRVLHAETVRPENFSRRVWRARCCIELLGGRAEASGIVAGTQLALEEQ